MTARSNDGRGFAFWPRCGCDCRAWYGAVVLYQPV
jgi:hypothetical protein